MATREPDFRDPIYAGCVEWAPGFYVRPDGSVIVNLERFHRLHGFPDDEASRAETIAMVRAEVERARPGARTIIMQKGFDEDGHARPVDENGKPLA